jgi:glycosyltransferase involved in cell wall biosynthesis
MVTEERASVLYVSKFPPSHSGVARYAAQFLEVLRQLANVETFVTGHEAPDGAGVRRIVNVVVSVQRQLREKPDWVVIELSGRAIAEFFACASVLCRRRRPLIWITVHDPPAVTGGLFWLSSLDRKGFRRLAAFLSATIGHRVERWVLERADAIVCLSKAGAAALTAEYSLSRVVRSIHPVARIASGKSARGDVFLPGPIIRLEHAEEAIDAVADACDLNIVIGVCDEPTERALRTHAEARGITNPIRFTGSLSQDLLDEVYGASLLVVHWRPNGSAGNVTNAAPCSYPVIDAMANGCALVTNGARGAREYIIESGAAIDLSDTPDQLGPVLADLFRVPDALARLGSRALGFANATLSTVAIAREANEIFREATPAGTRPGESGPPQRRRTGARSAAAR